MIKGFPLLVGLGLWALPMSAQAVPFKLHSKAWTDVGKVMKSSDTLQTNFNRNWQQTMGLQISGAAELGAHLQGGFGFGLNQVYHALGNSEQEKFMLSRYINYVSEARVTWTSDDAPNPLFSVDVGDFAFNYAPYVKNLGLYLFRGPVYPGFLVSGFKEYHTDTTRASFLGFHLHNGLGNFKQDLLFSSERDLPPSFDWSLGYIARYKALDAIEIGAGVNFYHLIAEREDITTPSSSVPGLFGKDSNLIASGAPYTPYQLQYFEVLPSGETVVYTHRGTKVMGMFNIDTKRLLRLEGMLGKKDLQVYGEAAIIGTKDYGTIYAKIGDRIPYMLGVNLPAFGLLDFFSLEVEHYGAKYRADYSKLGYDRSLYFKNINAPQLSATRGPSAIPVSRKDLAGEKWTILDNGQFYNPQTDDTVSVQGTSIDPENMTGDDWKWSLNAEKTVLGHVQFSGQVANDHFVPRPARTTLLNENGGLSQIFITMKDWYWMLRVGYSF